MNTFSARIAPQVTRERYNCRINHYNIYSNGLKMESTTPKAEIKFHKSYCIIINLKYITYSADMGKEIVSAYLTLIIK